MRIIRLIVNWSIFLTLPIWILPLFAYGLYKQKLTMRDKTYFIKGEKFIWHESDFC